MADETSVGYLKKHEIPQLIDRMITAVLRTKPSHPKELMMSFMRAEGGAHIFVINGFYMSMREKFTKDGASISYFVVEWDNSELSWADFRGKVLGGTDPKTAEKCSLRNTLFGSFKELGLSSEPNVGDNGIHASASPFEAMAERLNWLETPLADDPFAKALLVAGIPEDTIKEWTKDPQVEFEGGKKSLFDLLEDLDGEEVLLKAQKIAGVTGKVEAGKNSAFVFIKPHAVSDAVQKLVTERFAKEGIAILTQGSLGNKVIAEKKLIDNHYYAIANKASLTLPKDLNPPKQKLDEFESKFGRTWQDALDTGMVYNAVDACKRLNVDGERMATLWTDSKSSGDLLKFGGGFYCGKVRAV
eukprot:NODE_933_length_1225_cov_264.029762_g708_i0.p1 GENE.NODE_933_length_1225_cov_264.029762_g708_i0~~NODE_933_length_1225_cov_264.029762_g708_i0.p1  ORF type:complete len:378 (-),score=81.36 NODE_933_length_1225_cov_264.029762_g708_i0:90-1163(-)